MKFKQTGRIKVTAGNEKKIIELICESNNLEKPFQVFGMTTDRAEVGISTVYREGEILTVSVKKEYAEKILKSKIKSIAYFKNIPVTYFKEFRWDKNAVKNTSFFNQHSIFI